MLIKPAMTSRLWISIDNCYHDGTSGYEATQPDPRIRGPGDEFGSDTSVFEVDSARMKNRGFFQFPGLDIKVFCGVQGTRHRDKDSVHHK